jgi:peptidoglycan/LPS O-acetylase OafA/YrhL
MPITRRVPGSDIAGLTSLRFFAAIAVLFYHTLPSWDVPGLHFLWAVACAGSTGVSLFFVLSGFILFHVYGERIATGRFATRHFLAARIARIYPVYAFGLLLSLPGFARGTVETFRSGTQHFEAAVSAPLLLQAWIPDAACRWNCPGWSLSVEAFFYLTFPFVALFAIVIDRRTAAIGLVLAYAAMVAAPLLFVLSGLPIGDGDAGVDSALAALRFNPMLRLPEFVFGVLAARIALSMPPRLPKWAFYVTAAAVIAVLYGSSFLSDDFRETFVENGLYVPLYALLIVTVAGSPKPLLAGTAWVRLGAASYALYIIHMPIWSLFRFAAEHGFLGSPDDDPVVYGAYFITAIAGALLVHRWIEEPSRAFLRVTLKDGILPPLYGAHAAFRSRKVGEATVMRSREARG